MVICTVQPIGNIEDWYKALMIKDSGILYEDPYVQVSLFSLLEILGSISI